MPRIKLCLRDLARTDSRLDKKRIEREKGGLLKDAYRWVLDNPEFQQWRDGQDQLLWIKGDPGKGKTMLLCGIIDELAKSPASVSFFFCQAPDARINTATAVLCSLIYQLVDQKPALVSHVRKKYDILGKELFHRGKCVDALSEIFTGMLADPVSQSGYMIIDALDECIADLPLLLDLIVQEAEASHAKWLVSSRNWPNIQERLDTATGRLRLSLELNAESISAAVSTFIRYRVGQLARLKKYNKDTQDSIQHYLSVHANNTFLWAALVCQDLAKIPRWEALAKLTTFPPGLSSLYRRMLDQICSLYHADLYKRILAIVSVVYRPITLIELTSFVDVPAPAEDSESLVEIMELCGSFLTVQDCTISFVHQSAKDFLLYNAFEDICSDGNKAVHLIICSRSLQVMSKTLKRDIYRLRFPGFPIEQVTQPSPDPLAPARYSCIYWIDHLCDCNLMHVNDLISPLTAFFKQHYLYWLEALSLCKNVPRGILSMERLVLLLKVSFANQ